METEYIKEVILQHHPNSKLVGDVTHACFINGTTLSITLNDDKTWLYMMDENGLFNVYQKKSSEHRNDNMKSVFRQLKLNELTNEQQL